MLEKTQELHFVLGENVGKVCAGPWVLGLAIFGLRPAITREDCGSCTDELSLLCENDISTAASMLHQFILCDTPNSPISPARKMLLIVFILHLMQWPGSC